MSEENRTDQRKTREMLHYDEICKHLLSYKPILARILKECVEEHHDLSYEAIQACIETDLKGAHMHIIGRNTEDLTIPEAKILYDLLFTAALPKQKEQVALFINIEAQNRDDPSYPLLKRALYDGSRLLARTEGRAAWIRAFVVWRDQEGVYDLAVLWTCEEEGRCDQPVPDRGEAGEGELEKREGRL